MAHISFYPSKKGEAAIVSSDFEHGFESTEHENIFNFKGEWICPTNPVHEPNTQNLICVCEETGDCAAISASFTFNGSTAIVVGTMTVSKPETHFKSTGIPVIAANGGSMRVFPSTATHGICIFAPFLLGNVAERKF